MSNEPLEPEIVDVQDETDGTEETEYSEPTLCQIGYNSNVIVTPVRCSECDEKYYIKPDTIENVQYCIGCGVEFQAHDDEF